MFQRPDYTILDHLREICEVVGYNLCYLYVNNAAAEREHLSSDKLIGHAVFEVHPDIESTRLFRHLQECLEKRKSVEFEDKLPHLDSAGTKWKIKIDPVREGALLHATRLSADKTKVKIKETNGAYGPQQRSFTATDRSMARIQQSSHGPGRGFADRRLAGGAGTHVPGNQQNISTA